MSTTMRWLHVMGEGKGGVCRFYHSLDPVIMGLAVDKRMAKLRITRLMWKFYLHEVGWIKFTSLFVGDKKVSPLWLNTNCFLLVQQNLAHDFFGLSCLFWGWVWRLQRPFWWKQPQNGVGGQVIKTKDMLLFLHYPHSPVQNVQEWSEDGEGKSCCTMLPRHLISLQTGQV